MKKNVLLTSMVLCLVICNFSFANDLEKLEFTAPENHEYNIFMEGYFSKSGIALPNDTLFLYKCVHIKMSYGIIQEFKYSGMTEKKAFEIILTGSDLLPTVIQPIRERKKKRINLFFEENSLFPLSFVRLYSGCSNDEKVFLKMIKLQGNQLEYQIILPRCLKR